MLERPATVHTINSGIPIFSNWKRSRRNGMFRIRIRKIIAPLIIHVTALFGVERIFNIPDVHERFERITAIFETIKVTNVSVLTLFSEYPIFSPIKYISKQITKMPTPCMQLKIIFLAPKNGSLISLGGLNITFFSSFSASKIIEQAGSIINSRKTICTGHRMRGKSVNNTGIKDNPAIGTWIAKIYPNAF